MTLQSMPCETAAEFEEDEFNIWVSRYTVY